jgi:hypothetical protein
MVFELRAASGSSRGTLASVGDPTRQANHHHA